MNITGKSPYIANFRREVHQPLSRNQPLGKEGSDPRGENRHEQNSKDDPPATFPPYREYFVVGGPQQIVQDSQRDSGDCGEQDGVELLVKHVESELGIRGFAS